MLVRPHTLFLTYPLINKIMVQTGGFLFNIVRLAELAS